MITAGAVKGRDEKIAPWSHRQLLQNPEVKKWKVPPNGY
jgi:hypothetical protein